jgi:hypothetical protein
MPRANGHDLLIAHRLPVQIPRALVIRLALGVLADPLAQFAQAQIENDLPPGHNLRRHTRRKATARCGSAPRSRGGGLRRATTRCWICPRGRSQLELGADYRCDPIACRSLQASDPARSRVLRQAGKALQSVGYASGEQSSVAACSPRVPLLTKRHSPGRRGHSGSERAVSDALASNPSPVSLVVPFIENRPTPSRASVAGVRRRTDSGTRRCSSAALRG